MKDEWALITDNIDGVDCLILTKTMEGLGRTVICYYAESTGKTWHQYFHGFPKKEFLTKEACIKNAEGLAGQILKIEERQ